MHRLTFLLLLATPALSLAAPPNTPRTAVHHSIIHQPYVITSFAVPVAVPVAPLAPYWYGLSQFQIHDEYVNSARKSSNNRRHANDVPAVESTLTLVEQKCAACHGATSPKAGLRLTAPAELSAESRLDAIRAVLDRRMPPKPQPPLTDAEITELLKQFSQLD